jgi:CRISPR/Cas system Type II protein with McrA/HNH and RuvC-like nuclease domain
MENNFGMEAIISNGLGFTDSLFNTKKSNFDGDFDSMSLEIGSTENLVNFAETYNELDAYNASQKIRMIKKLHIHTRNVPGKYGKSVENFLVEQSLEDAAALDIIPTVDKLESSFELFTLLWLLELLVPSTFEFGLDVLEL